MASGKLVYLQQQTGREISDSRSPAGNWLLPRLESIEKGTATLSVVVREEMCNPFGNIHGGMIALVADEAIGWAVVSLEADRFYTSVNLAVDFLYAASLGERIFVTAEIVRQGKKILYAQVTVINEKKILIAKASSNLVVTGMEAMAH